MKTLNGEPSELVLHRIFEHQQTRRIIVDGQHGTIAGADGGWGQVAIIARFGDATLVKCDRESDDYEQNTSESCPDRLETYDWQYEDEERMYYITLRNALARRKASNKST